MSNNKSLQGTGNEFGRIDLGSFGTLVIKDDGDNDVFVRIEIEGKGVSLQSHCHNIRQNYNDQKLVEMLDEIETSTSINSDDTVDRSALGYTSGPFVCDDCGLTWPSKKNRTPDGRENLCPECVDGD